MANRKKYNEKLRKIEVLRKKRLRKKLKRKKLLLARERYQRTHTEDAPKPGLST